MAQTWEKWEFSPDIQDRVRAFAARVGQQEVDSAVIRRWRYLKNIKFKPRADKSHVEELNESRDAECDIDGLITSTIEGIESCSDLDEAKFYDLSTNQLSRVFTEVEKSLTEPGFTHFCRVVTKWKLDKLVNVCFDNVILQKLLEKEEATLATINSVKEVGISKSGHLSKCIKKLLTNETKNFSDAELLKEVFDVLPDNLKEDVVRAMIQKQNFKESDWQLLQVLAFKTKNSLQSIITFMNSKCEEYADSQAFSRLLVHICKNLESDKHKPVLLNVIEKNRSLLRHQARKYLSAV